MKPENSESVELSSVSPARPPVISVEADDTTTPAVRTSDPSRENECGPRRCHGYSSISTRATPIVGRVAVKCRASSSANASGEATPCCFANAYTVFFWVSVGSTFALSPVRWVAARSPESETLTFRSVTVWVPPSRTTRTTRVSALPY